MSEVKVNKISPRSGTTVTLGDNGDTITIPSGVTLDASSGGLAGTLTTAAQPNITSVGTLTSFTSTGIDDNATSTAITIDSSGSVGIGTSSPSAELHISKSADAGNAEFLIENSFATAGSTDEIVQIQGRFGGYDASYIITGKEADFTTSGNRSSFMSFWTRGAGTLAEAMRINSSGNVGIGTTSPDSKVNIEATKTTALSTAADFLTMGLTIDDNTAFDNIGVGGGICFRGKRNAGGVQTVYAAIDAGKASAAGDSYTGILRFYTNQNSTGVPLERMRIDSSGKVGIGTASPTAELHIENSSNPTILIKNPTNGNDANLNINKAGSSSRGIIRFQSTGGTTWHVGSTRFTTTGFAISSNDDYNGASEFRLTTTGLTLAGSLSKGSGSFKIDHPLPEKTNTHHLVHSFVESPQANNIYRGKVDLVSGTATVNIDTVSGMTEGTFVLLNRDIQCFTSNETGWTAVKGSVSENILTITAQDNTCTDTISWMVIGERQDQHMYDTEWTDDNGKVIVEPLKETEE